MAFYLIKNHHLNLQAFESFEDLSSRYDNDFEYNHKKKCEDINKKIELINGELDLESKINPLYLNIQGKRSFFKIIRPHTTKNANLENYFLVLYCFSLLIEADKMDAAETKIYEPKIIDSRIVSKYITQKGISENELNKDRTEVRNLVSQKVNDIDINKGNLFTLTAPTGIGKTLTSVEFALKLKEKMEEKGQKVQIIYCLPFINIIEQVAGEFEKLFDNDIRVLKHHKYSDISKNDEEKEEKYSFEQSLMELECWQGDIIITTFVQFFHTIIGNKNKLLKKFHHLANSIIILDEVQSIDAKYWPLVGIALNYLTKLLNSQILLMTATRPFIKEAANKLITTNKNIGKKASKINSLSDIIEEMPLLDNYNKYFKKLNRTKLVPIIKDDEYSIEDFIELFIDKRKFDQSALIVVNTIKKSIEIYDELKKYVEKKNLFYLSTNIVPAKRRWIIKKVRQLIKDGVKVVLVATQCIEAGVDLDFDIGFRDIAPLDSIIQVAGRINRNNDPSKKFSPLYILNFKNDSINIYGSINIDTCKKILMEKQNEKSYIEEPEYVELINNYFEEIIKPDVAGEGKDFTDSFYFLKAMEKLNFDVPKNSQKDTEEKPINEFRLIKEKGNYVDLFVEANWKASIISNFYKNECLYEKDKRLKKQKYGQIKKLLNYFIISVPQRLILEPDYLDEKRGLYILRTGQEQEKYYNEITGFIRSKIEEGTLIF